MKNDDYYSSEEVLGIKLFPREVLRHYKPKQLEKLKTKATSALDIIKGDSRRGKGRVKDLVRFCKQIDKTKKLCLE